MNYISDYNWDELKYCIGEKNNKKFPQYYPYVCHNLKGTLILDVIIFNQEGEIINHGYCHNDEKWQRLNKQIIKDQNLYGNLFEMLNISLSSTIREANSIY
jgi:hypothetical protein